MKKIGTTILKAIRTTFSGSNFFVLRKLTPLFFSVVLLSSCAGTNDPDGKWDDNIKLSMKEVAFESKADSVLITTAGDWWWVGEISFDDSTYSYYNNDNINLESASYAIIENSFVVERRDKNTLFIKLDENTTEIERSLIIGLQAGNYFDAVTIKQLPN